MDNPEKITKIKEFGNEELEAFKVDTSEFVPENKKGKKEAYMKVIRDIEKENNEINPSNSTIEEVVAAKKKEIENKLDSSEVSPFDLTIEEANSSKNKVVDIIEEEKPTGFFNKIKNYIIKKQENILIKKGESYIANRNDDGKYKDQLEELKDTDPMKAKKWLIALGRGWGSFVFDKEKNDYIEKPGKSAESPSGSR